MASGRAAAADRESGADSDEGLILTGVIKSRRQIIKELEAEEAARRLAAACESRAEEKSVSSARVGKSSTRKTDESRKAEGSSTQAPAAPRRRKQKTSGEQAGSELQMPTRSEPAC
jgi:hypothetical protein